MFPAPFKSKKKQGEPLQQKRGMFCYYRTEALITLNLPKIRNKFKTILLVKLP